MNKLIFTFIALFFLNNCSFNENSRIWKDKENKLETDKKITKVFAEENISVSEFNRDLKLDLSSIKINNKKNENQNNLGLQNYKGELTKIGNFKFSKLEELNQLDFKPIFLKNEDGELFPSNEVTERVFKRFSPEGFPILVTIQRIVVDSNGYRVVYEKITNEKGITYFKRNGNSITEYVWFNESMGQNVIEK